MKHNIFTLLFLTISFSFAQNTITSEDILITNDSIKLPGTLTYNEDLEKQSLIIFVPGSGNPNRNGNQPQLGVKGSYIKQLSSILNSKGFAFFRYDKRNVTQDNVKYLLKSYEFSDLVSDVSTIINNFKNDKRFNNITLIGHSQGSLVAMMAINNVIDKYISLAGLGESADKTIVRQITAQDSSFGKIAKAHIDELKLTGTIKEVNPALISLFAAQNHQFLSSYFKLDPQEEIKKLTLPILILNGTKDLQVKEKDAYNLHNANPKSKLVMIKDMNHVLKTITKEEDNLKSYTSPDFPLSEELITIIEAFIKQ
ncbi:alpha/beta hydrolase [Flavobacteriaceae bacterium AU392]|nr:alpha/beta hydrolase [Flavobacteriaceae bacterium]RKM81136.1 alpha/beta hydrolase [Flavobacteriaceae bacterium AU392]